MIRFGSICSGIEAASVAWHPLGWRAAWLAEIEAFPSAVLAHHYPDVPNLGDMTTIARRVLTGEVEAPDVLTGGTPCQAFSVAGLRESLADQRGNLTLKFVELADAIDHVRRRAGKPAVVVKWENVPGVLSTKDNAFGCFLAGLAGEDEPLEPPGGRWADSGCVYGPARAVAWRTLDAQFFGLAQRRRRVFVVASARAGFDPATVLFEWQGVRRDSAPRREAGQGTAAGPERSAFGGGNTAGPIDVGTCLTHHSGRNDFDSETFIAHSLRGEGFDASEDGTGRGTPLVPVGVDGWNGRLTGDVAATMGTRGSSTTASGPQVLGFNWNAQADQQNFSEHTTPTLTRSQEPAICFGAKDHGADAQVELSPTLRAGGHSGSHANAGVMPAVALSLRGREGGATAELGGEVQNALRASGGGGDKAHILAAMQVRRLTPRECERLQGFPDDYTLVPFGRPSKAKLDADFVKYQLRGNPKHLSREDIERLASDGPRYKALGNSWAVPCARWIGARIHQEIAA